MFIDELLSEIYIIRSRLVEGTSDVSLLLDRLQRGAFHEELHQLGSDLLGVRVPRRAGCVRDRRLGGWKKCEDIYRPWFLTATWGNWAERR